MNDAVIMFQYFVKVLKEYLQIILSRLIKEEEQSLIDNFIKETNNWKILTNWLIKIFCYIDRINIKVAKMKTLFWHTMDLFKMQVSIVFYDSS